MKRTRSLLRRAACLLLAEPIAVPDLEQLIEVNRKWEAEHYGES